MCMYPVMSDADYYSVMEKTDRIWLFAVPVVIAVILLQAWLFATRIKKSIARINDAIGAYQRNEKFEVDRVRDIRPAASLKSGGAGIRYTCSVEGRLTYLFLEETKWFLEPAC